MEKAEGEAAEWVQNMMRDYQNKLTRGLFETIYEADAPCADGIMDGLAKSCVAAFIDLSSIDVPMDLGAFLEHMRTSGPSQVDIQRDGNVIHWNELHKGECVCPLIRLDVIRLDPKLCVCGAQWVKRLFKVAAGTDVEVETVETAATGAQNCSFRITVDSAMAQDGQTASQPVS